MTSSNPDRPGRPLAVITGGSSGIGAAFARRVAADHDVVLGARRPDRLASVRDELARDHPDGRFDTVTADLSTSDGTGAVVERLARGGVDLLVNNAGAGSTDVSSMSRAIASPRKSRWIALRSLC